MKRIYYFILLTFLLTTISGANLNAQDAYLEQDRSRGVVEPVVNLPQIKTIYNNTSVTIDGTLTNEGDFDKVSYIWIDSFGRVVSNNPVIKVNEEQELTLTVKTSNGVTKSFEPVRVQLSSFRVPEGISPNGDGLNDNFKLDELASDPGIDVVYIYDRRGVLVFEKDNYVNEFNGKNDNGDDLPAASYYYVIKLLNGEKITGWFQLIR